MVLYSKVLTNSNMLSISAERSLIMLYASQQSSTKRCKRWGFWPPPVMKCCISDVKMNGDRSLSLQKGVGRFLLIHIGVFELTVFYIYISLLLLYKTPLLSLSKFSPHSTDLPFKASKLLCIAHNFAKVNVEHVSTVFQHDVVIVAVTDPQDECGHTPPCA